ncbi:MAG: glycosyltransferase family 2 protein [Gammaproteobacteria bacterium]|nr:MAG: glycosyltransferase family 2 protein [Gammaproteobacteria bacterium]RLA14601.1 MAG: glycosyltransferase family 2 protein [Gammaproteobacteria bacterium]
MNEHLSDQDPTLSIILPAKNEGKALTALLPELKRLHPAAEIIVVDDGSDDDTADLCRQNSVIHIRHPYSKGNGAAIKSGALAASGEYLVMLDADGQHPPAAITEMIEKLNTGFDMVVAARDFSSQASMARGIANTIYNKFASLMTGQKILDLTSGMRAVRAKRFRQFLPLLPNGFSYPSTITMAFFRSGYNVAYLPVTASDRIGKSHLRPLQDGIRFLLIIFKLSTLYSPLKIFFPIALIQTFLGLAYYTYTYLSDGRFTNMGVTLMVSAVTIFLIGLVSEQITMLLYARLDNNDQD